MDEGSLHTPFFLNKAVHESSPLALSFESQTEEFIKNINNSINPVDMTCDENLLDINISQQVSVEPKRHAFNESQTVASDSQQLAAASTLARDFPIDEIIEDSIAAFKENHNIKENHNHLRMITNLVFSDDINFNAQKSRATSDLRSQHVSTESSRRTFNDTQSVASTSQQSAAESTLEFVSSVPTFIEEDLNMTSNEKKLDSNINSQIFPGQIEVSSKIEDIQYKDIPIPIDIIKDFYQRKTISTNNQDKPVPATSAAASSQMDTVTKMVETKVCMKPKTSIGSFNAQQSDLTYQQRSQQVYHAGEVVASTSSQTAAVSIQSVPKQVKKRKVETITNQKYYDNRVKKEKEEKKADEDRISCLKAEIKELKEKAEILKEKKARLMNKRNADNIEMQI